MKVKPQQKLKTI